MNTLRNRTSRMPTGLRIGIVVGWVIIIAKCLATPWAINHWQVPIHPGWVIIPTLLLAGLITVMMAAHNWSSDED